MTSLERAFAEHNPSAKAVSIVEFRREGRGGGANIVLARAIVPDMVFRGRMEDELFGVFLFDDSLRAIRRTLDVFPSPRWNDYSIHIERSSGESLFVSGLSPSGADSLVMRAYRWKGAAAEAAP